MLELLDVIWVHDGTIDPPKLKMVVAISIREGLFLRINSKPNFRPTVKLPKEPDHSFLEHDSYLNCGTVLELDDYIISESLRRNGEQPYGYVSPDLIPEIKDAIYKGRIRYADRKIIFEELYNFQVKDQ
ncbi:hypothetical protein [Parvularcula sp. IMCC14364]|uniref:hypothetical protein n=1 Tax=Parvularcula sp. IMCC14364 TaxID=3067902 RepID=UPI0027427DEB|nr:hypothetical protein [Parvularcula sp. IMCC14364]